MLNLQKLLGLALLWCGSLLLLWCDESILLDLVEDGGVLPLLVVTGSLVGLTDLCWGVESGALLLELLLVLLVGLDLLFWLSLLGLLLLWLSLSGSWVGGVPSGTSGLTLGNSLTGLLVGVFGITSLGTPSLSGSLGGVSITFVSN